MTTATLLPPPEARLWKAVDRRRHEWDRIAIRTIGRQFDRERVQVVAAFEQGTSADEAIVRAEFAITSEQAAWIETVERLYGLVAVDFAGHAWRRVLRQAGKQGEPIDRWRRSVDEWLQVAGGNRITRISETTRILVRQELIAGVDAGENVERIGRRLTGLYRGAFTLERSVLIARTEVIAASNLGSQAGARSTDLELDKFWIATQDDRVREAHSAADGQTRPIAFPYVVMGQELMFPGDTSLGATAANVILCRCTEGYRRRQ